MSRPLRELIKDFEDNPTRWDVVRTEVMPSTNVRNKGGSSVQELLRHKLTGEEIVRHQLLRPNGRLFGQPHFRDSWK